MRPVAMAEMRWRCRVAAARGAAGGAAAASRCGALRAPRESSRTPRVALYRTNKALTNA